MQTLTDTFRYRFILTNLVAKEFKVMYRSMSLGFVWALLQPLVLVALLTTVWVVFFGQTTAFAVMVLVALIPYNFFSYCLSGCTASIVTNAPLIKKVAFPRQILPFAVILTHLIHLGVQSILIVVALMIFDTPNPVFGAQLLWLPLILVVQLGLVVGVGLLTSSLYVKYRDTQYVVDSLLNLLFWGSPVLYDARPKLDALDVAWVPWLYYANPLAGIVEAYRSVLYFGTAPDSFSLSMATVVTLVVGYIGVRTFWRQEREFADLV